MDMMVKLAKAYGTDLRLVDDAPCHKGDDDCHKCRYRENVPGNAHIKCNMPPPDMGGSSHGAKNGWFMFPLLFDPTWRCSPCSTFEPVTPVNHAVKSSGQSDKPTVA